MQKAANIVIYGAGINRPIAQIASYQLLTKGFQARSASPSVSEHQIIKHLNEKDVAIFISYSGETQKIVSLLKNINKNVETIAITMDNNNSLSKKVKYKLLVPNIDSDYKHSKRIVRLCKMIVIDSLMDVIPKKKLK